jgi:hypothetical protein
MTTVKVITSQKSYQPKLLDVIYSSKRKIILNYLLSLATKYGFSRRTIHLTMIYYDIYSKKINKIPSLNVALVCLYLASGMIDTVQFDIRSYYYHSGVAAEAPAIMKGTDMLIDAVIEKLEYRLYWKTPVEKIISYAIRFDRPIARTKQDLYIATLGMMESELSIISASSVARRIRILTDCLFDGKDIAGLLKDNIYCLIIKSFQLAPKIPNLVDFCFSRSGNYTIVPYSCPEIIVQLSSYQKPVKLFGNCLTPPLCIRPFSFSNRNKHLYDLGAGTFGVVEAVKVDGKDYAIKKATNQTNQLTYLREVNNFGRMTGDEHIIQMDSIMYHSRPGGIRCYIWFELAETNLYEFLRRGIPNAETRITFISDLINGVAVLHSKNLIHRDLSSKNILIKNNRLIIGDLGSAKIVYPSLESDETETYYSYPELSTNVCAAYTRPMDVIFGNKYYSYDLDIWSVGCLIYLILTGELLFYGIEEEDVIYSIYQTLGVAGTEKFKVLPNYIEPESDIVPDTKIEDFKRRFPSFAKAVTSALLYHGNSRPDIFSLRKMIFEDQDIVS